MNTSMELTTKKISEAARLLREAKPRKPPEGRAKVICICPTCDLEDAYVKLNAHLHHCPKNAAFDPEINTDIVLITLAEFRAALNETMYACPVGCDEHKNYREMLKHIPVCSRRNPILPYTVPRWRQELIKSQTQPGTDTVRKNRRTIVASAKKNGKEEKQSAPSTNSVPATA